MRDAANKSGFGGMEETVRYEQAIAKEAVAIGTAERSERPEKNEEGERLLAGLEELRTANPLGHRCDNRWRQRVRCDQCSVEA